MLTREEFLKSDGPNHDKTRSDVGAVNPTTDAHDRAFHDRYKGGRMSRPSLRRTPKLEILKLARS